MFAVPSQDKLYILVSSDYMQELKLLYYSLERSLSDMQLMLSTEDGRHNMNYDLATARSHFI